jgi:head-tail adaptor
MLMYRPSEAAQMTTAMLLQQPSVVTEYGVSTKGYTDTKLVVYCNFKSFGGTEKVSNDVLIVEDTAQIVCWYHPDITADRRLKRLSDGAVFEILGTPENIEMRNQFLKFKIRRVKGGA